MDSAKAAEFLEMEEGRRHHVYQDSLGYWTIGCGRLVDARLGGGLSDNEIDYMLANDIREKWGEVSAALPWVATLGDARQFVLLSMAFQMGTAGLLEFRNTLTDVREGDYAAAANGMLASKWAQQTPGRAGRLAEQMRTGQWVKKPMTA